MPTTRPADLVVATRTRWGPRNLSILPTISLSSDVCSQRTQRTFNFPARPLLDRLRAKAVQGAIQDAINTHIWLLRGPQHAKAGHTSMFNSQHQRVSPTGSGFPAFLLGASVTISGQTLFRHTLWSIGYRYRV